MRRRHDDERPREERDVELGRALDELDSPDYPPDFLASVWARVDAEEGAARRPAPEHAVPEATESATGGGWLRLPRRSRSLWSRHPVLATAAAFGIAAAVAAAVLIGLPGVSRLSGPQPVSAAQVIQKALHALSSGKTLQTDATMKYTVALLPGKVPEYDVVRYRLLMRDDGSFRRTRTQNSRTSGETIWGMSILPADPNGIDTAYDATSGVVRDYYLSSEAPGLRTDVTKDAPLGPPDRWADFGVDLSATALALQAGGKATVNTTSYEGRPVWVISMSGGLAGPLSLDPHETALITIDQRTCLPTRFQAVQDGVVKLEMNWKNMRIDEPLPDSAFTFAPPKDVRVYHSDGGFRRLPLAGITSAKGYVTLVPGWLPSGYAQRWCAAAARSSTANGATKGRHVVAIKYTRGFDALTVTTRRVRDPRSAATNDPFEVEPNWGEIVSQDIKLTAGAFAGVTARVVVAPRITIPHLYAVKDDVLLTIAGGASAKELVAIAESLRPYRPD